MRIWTDSATKPSTRITIVEIDTAWHPSRPGDDYLRYETFENRPEHVDLLLAQARYFSEFGRQAPAHRGCLLVLETGGCSTGLPDRTWQGLRIVDPDAHDVAVLQRLVEEGRLRSVRGLLQLVGPTADESEMALTDALNQTQLSIFHPAGKGDFRNEADPPTDIDLVVPTSFRGGFLSRSSNDISFNSGFFVLAEEELVSDPFNRLYDPIGLTIERGVITSPPLYSRPALLGLASSRRRGAIDALRFAEVGGGQYPSEWAVVQLSIADVNIHLSGLDVPIDGCSAVMRTNAVRGCHWEADSVVLAVVGRKIMAAGRASEIGPNSSPPMNGFLLSVPRQTASSVDLAAGVSYSFKRARLQAALTGAGGWRIVVHKREVTVNDPSFTGEFRSLRDSDLQRCLPPVHLSTRYATASNRSIIAAGVSRDARLFIVHAEGTEPRMERGDVDSLGSSLEQVAQILVDLGCEDALALDGGGSALVSSRGKLLTKPADRYGIPLIGIERPLPGAWQIQES